MIPQVVPAQPLEVADMGVVVALGALLFPLFRHLGPTSGALDMLQL